MQEVLADGERAGHRLHGGVRQLGVLDVEGEASAFLICSIRKVRPPGAHLDVQAAESGGLACWSASAFSAMIWPRAFRSVSPRSSPKLTRIDRVILDMLAPWE